MHWFKRFFMPQWTKSKKEIKFTSYDVTLEENNTYQKVREGNEPEAMHQRGEKSK